MNTTEEPLIAENFAWPTVELDPVERMRILTAGLPYAAIRETTFDVEFDRFWSFIADLEGSTSRYETMVSSVRIQSHEGERIRLDTTLFPGLMRQSFDAVLRPGWCVMRSRWVELGMAARPEGPSRTRFIHFEGSPRGGSWLRPYFHWNVGRDFHKLRTLFAA